jgi:hypothetical protein
MQIAQTTDAILVSQYVYAQRLVERSHVLTANPRQTPLNPSAFPLLEGDSSLINYLVKY